MRVVNIQFEILECVFASVHVDLQYDKICLTSTAGSVCLCGVCSLCGRLWSVCDVDLVPCVVGAVVACTVVCV